MTDYNEPWESDDYSAWDNNGYRAFTGDGVRDDYAPRIVECINACAGMADPASDITTLRQQVAQTEADNKHLIANLDRLQAENEHAWACYRAIKAFNKNHKMRITELLAELEACRATS